MPFSNGFSTGFAGVGLDEGTLQHLEAVADQLGWRWWEFHEWPGSIAPGTVGMTARVAAPGLDDSGQRDRWEVHIVWSGKEPKSADRSDANDLRRQAVDAIYDGVRNSLVDVTVPTALRWFMPRSKVTGAVGSKSEPAYVGWVITVEEA